MFFPGGSVIFLKGVSSNDNLPFPGEPSFEPAGVLPVNWDASAFALQTAQPGRGGWSQWEAPHLDFAAASEGVIVPMRGLVSAGAIQPGATLSSALRQQAGSGGFREMWLGVLIIGMDIVYWSGPAHGMAAYSGLAWKAAEIAENSKSGIVEGPTDSAAVREADRPLDVEPVALGISVAVYETASALIDLGSAADAGGVSEPAAGVRPHLTSTQLSDAALPALTPPSAQSVHTVAYVFGTEGRDIIVGGNGADVLFGHGGDDILLGGAGDDRLNGGDGNDFMDGGVGADVMRGGHGDDSYVVDNGNDKVIEHKDQGTDTVYVWTTIKGGAFAAPTEIENVVAVGGKAFLAKGNSHDNILIGGLGESSLSGGEGNDQLFATAQTAYDLAGSHADSVSNSDDIRELARTALSLFLGDTPHLLLVGSDEGASFIDAEEALEKLINDRGNPVERLLAAHSVLDGGDGNDVIAGDRGDDTLRGGHGNDIFIFGSGFGNDVIEDFGSGSGDHDLIYFADRLFKDYEDLESRMYQEGADLIIVATQYDQVTLKNFEKMTLAMHDHFVFL